MSAVTLESTLALTFEELTTSLALLNSGIKGAPGHADVAFKWVMTAGVARYSREALWNLCREYGMDNSVPTVEFLSEVLLAWDLESNGAIVPITEASLAALPGGLLHTLRNAIEQDMAMLLDGP
jgi:hypothetical protein